MPVWVSRMDTSTAEAFVGTSEVLRQQLNLLNEYAVSDAPIHIFGETGTGKELVARAIHARSQRAASRFVAQNCAALPDSLLHSLLFGHQRGAFTGADQTQLGILEAANKGTLFLDEIADMSVSLQAAVLRVLEGGDYCRVGSVTPSRLNVRIVSATNASLRESVDDGRFRKDLFYRLTTLCIRMPPLRERGDDVMTLAKHFLEGFNARTGKNIRGFDASCVQVLTQHLWPGNVRELRSEVERACILTPRDGVISPAAFSFAEERSNANRATTKADCAATESLPEVLGRIERECIADAMDRAAGNRTRAAALLGVSRQRLALRLQRWKME